jgi:Tlde1 domain
MAYIAATHGERSSGPGMSLPGKVARRGKVARASKVAWAVTVFAVASAAAAWFAGFNPTAWVVADAAPTANAVLTFNDRFAPGAGPSVDASARLLVQSWSSEIELKLQQAKSQLAQKLQSEKLLPQDFRTAPIDDPKPAVANANASGIPLPRARPVEPKLEAESAPPSAAAFARPDDRTLLQKFSDLLPTGRITLASLAPNGGPYHDGPDLGALGYDKLTAVYDISAHAVYLPNGSRLEAHSGMGNLMDDPEHVNLRMVGATPPTTYDLKPREKLFHGVEALRMIPLDGSATLGRSGLLTHSFMLGPNGQSNGCVSIRNYDSFLQAYKDGVINRLVVVPSLNNAVVASRQS